MKVWVRWLVALVVIIVLGGILEFSLRAFLPTMVEGGSRLALRVPEESPVTVDTEGSFALNAFRWRIADTTVTAADVPLTDGITARATLQIGAMPLFPAFGKLRDGTATFTIPADQIEATTQLMSGGMAEWSEVRDGTLHMGGTITNDQLDFDVPVDLSVPYEGVADLSVVDGDMVIDMRDVTVENQGFATSVIVEMLQTTHTVCIADRLPAGLTLTSIELQAEGDIILRADLSETLLSNPDERRRGSCEVPDDVI